MFFSVVIPHYNEAENLFNCLTSIKNNKPKTHKIEVIIVDDFSRINDFKIIKKKILKIKNLKIKLIRNKKNYGPAKARNVGAFFVKSKYILFLDSDTEIEKKTIEIFLDKIKKNPIIVGIYNFVPIRSDLSSIYKSSFEYFFQFKDGKERRVLTFHSAIAGIQKKIFDQLGGFDENLHFELDYENEEFGRRLSKNYKLKLIPKLKVKHDSGSFLKIFRCLINRTKNWVFYNFFINNTKNKFDKNATTSIGMAFNVINTFFILLSIFLFFFTKNNYFLPIIFVFIMLNFYNFRKYYSFLFEKYQFKVILLVLLNIIFCSAVAFGAFLGFFKILLNKLK